MTQPVHCECGERVPRGTTNCPHCGRPLAQAPADAEPHAKSLWSVMGKREPTEPSQEPAQPPTTDSGENDKAAPAKGLWSVMQHGTQPPDTSTDDALIVDEARAASSPEPPPFLEPDPESFQRPGATNTRRSMRCGILAVVLAVFGLMPGLWVLLPALFAGLAALLWGFMALGEIRLARKGKQSVLGPAGGMLLGTCGMLLAPTLFHSLGTAFRASNDREQTRADLKAIGNGLDGFYKQNDSYPPGGMFRDTKDRGTIPMHGWMTTLLPYVGQADLYRKIDLEQPYDAPANRGPMSRSVPPFQGPGLDPLHSPRGLGLASYSGLGGELTDDEYGYRTVGIFDRNSRVRREDVVDGLSQTMIVGEVATNIPEWGDPGNWRSIGSGLNSDPTGFGNTARNGAHFLMADGSVRFFSNRTDLKVLKAMSTRDGQEKLPRTR